MLLAWLFICIGKAEGGYVGITPSLSPPPFPQEKKTKTKQNYKTNKPSKKKKEFNV